MKYFVDGFLVLSIVQTLFSLFITTLPAAAASFFAACMIFEIDLKIDALKVECLSCRPVIAGMAATAAMEVTAGIAAMASTKQ